MTDDTASRIASNPYIASVFNPKEPKGSVLTLNMYNVTKLIATNYIVWSQQIQFLLEGYELQTLISSDVIFLPVVIIENGLAQPNPIYSHLKWHDPLLYSALLGALSNSTQSLVSWVTSSLVVWTTLEHTYGHPTSGHIKQLKNQSKHAQKAPNWLMNTWEAFEVNMIN